MGSTKNPIFTTKILVAPLKKSIVKSDFNHRGVMSNSSTSEKSVCIQKNLKDRNIKTILLILDFIYQNQPM